MEYYITLQCRSRIVNVHDRTFDSRQGFKCLLNQMLTALCQNLNRHIIRNQISLNQLPQKIIFNLGSTRKSNLDFLKSQFYKQVKEFNFLFYHHWLDQSLVTVSQIHTTPDRCLFNLFIWPGTLFKVYNRHSFISFIV